MNKSTSMKIKTLLTEHASNPLGLDKTNPRFFWKLSSDVRGSKQTAYRILVSSNKDNITKDIGDMWDSGRVESGINTNIEYIGDELCSKRRYFWKL